MDPTTTTTTRTFKVNLGDEIRRFKLPVAPGPFAYPTFEAKLFEIFNGDDLTFKYKDVDGDLITIGNADDFNQLLAEQPADPVRLFAAGAAASPTSRPAPLQPDEADSEASLEAEECAQAIAAVEAMAAAEAAAATEAEAAATQAAAAEDLRGKARLARAEAKAAADAETARIQAAAQIAQATADAAREATRIAAEEAAAAAAAAQAERRAAAAAEAARVKAEADAKEAARLAAIEAELRKPVEHPHVVCDGSGLAPLTGTRYHLAGGNFDLCEAEFAKLPEPEKQLYEIVLRPGAAPIRYEPVIHYGVTCDGSGASPIIGARFHRIGEDYDLSQPEFARLDELEKRKFELIVAPRSAPVPYYVVPEPSSPPEVAAAATGNTAGRARKDGGGGGRCGTGSSKGRCCPVPFFLGLMMFATLFGVRALIVSGIWFGIMKATGVRPRENHLTAAAVVVASIAKCCCLFPLIAMSLIARASCGQIDFEACCSEEARHGGGASKERACSDRGRGGTPSWCSPCRRGFDGACGTGGAGQPKRGRSPTNTGGDSSGSAADHPKQE